MNMTSRPSAMRVPSPSAPPVTEKPAPIEMRSAPGNLPAVAEPSQNGTPIVTTAPIAPATPTFPTTGIANIAQAISAVMSEIGIVVKDGQNKFQNYKYAKMEDILQQLTPLIGKNGLAIIQTELDRSMFDNDSVIAVRYAFTIMHKSGDVWPERPIQTGVSRCRDSKGGFDDKALNKAHTAARKYFLLALFQIPTGDEDDADRGEVPSSAPLSNTPRRAPVPSPSGKIAPHVVSTANEKVQTWALKFLACIAKAESEAELTEWEKLNGSALDLVFEKAPLLYETVLKAFDKRRAEFVSPPPAQATQQEAVQRPSATPSPDTRERPTSTPAPTAASQGIPDAASQPDEFLKWADAELAKVVDPHSLEVMYNDYIEPQAAGLLPPDKEELAGILGKHERRLEP